MISTNSPVMTAWRVLLNRIWYLPIMSPALRGVLKNVNDFSYIGRLQHTSIAFRRADCSQAWPSARAQKREFDKAYSRRLARASSSISKAEKLAISHQFDNLKSTSKNTHESWQSPPQRKPRWEWLRSSEH